MTTPFIPGQAVPSRYRRARHIDREVREFLAPRPPLPIQQHQSDDIRHVWSEGEWLDLLSYRYYKDPTLWWVIADANQITEMRVIEVGRELRFPSLQRLILDLAPLLE